jgi:hypothetical protein
MRGWHVERVKDLQQLTRQYGRYWVCRGDGTYVLYATMKTKPKLEPIQRTEFEPIEEDSLRILYQQVGKYLYSSYEQWELAFMRNKDVPAQLMLWIRVAIVHEAYLQRHPEQAGNAKDILSFICTMTVAVEAVRQTAQVEEMKNLWNAISHDQAMRWLVEKMQVFDCAWCQHKAATGQFGTLPVCTDCGQQLDHAFQAATEALEGEGWKQDGGIAISKVQLLAANEESVRLGLAHNLSDDIRNLPDNDFPVIAHFLFPDHVRLMLVLPKDGHWVHALLDVSKDMFLGIQAKKG